MSKMDFCPDQTRQYKIPLNTKAQRNPFLPRKKRKEQIIFTMKIMKVMKVRTYGWRYYLELNSFMFFMVKRFFLSCVSCISLLNYNFLLLLTFQLFRVMIYTSEKGTGLKI